MYTWTIIRRPSIFNNILNSHLYFNRAYCSINQYYSSITYVVFESSEDRAQRRNRVTHDSPILRSWLITPSTVNARRNQVTQIHSTNKLRRLCNRRQGKSLILVLWKPGCHAPPSHAHLASRHLGIKGQYLPRDGYDRYDPLLSMISYTSVIDQPYMIGRCPCVIHNTLGYWLVLDTYFIAYTFMY